MILYLCVYWSGK